MDLPDPDTLRWSDIRVRPDIATTLAGLASVSDWIASDLPTKHHAGTDVDLTSYVRTARKRERAKVEKLAWAPCEPPCDTGFPFGSAMTPFPIQSAVETTVGGLQGPGIVAVIAPTGEGKTQAAIQAVVALVHPCDPARRLLRDADAGDKQPDLRRDPGIPALSQRQDGAAAPALDSGKTSEGTHHDVRRRRHRR
ncbi:hypothetical protein [Embleya sp. NPDC005971]|uniref:hypothetical protein n=1 Tax=Embleya sp. NPDC005971 TaxID=3156724 RepID=UPI0033F970C9